MIRRRWILVLLGTLLSVSLGERISLAKAQADASAGMNWQPSLDEAKRVAALSNKLILVHFWAPSCKDCKRLEKDVLAQPQVQQAVNARFVPFKLNADDYPTTTKQYGVDRLPTDLIITPAGQIVGRMKCPLTPDVYIQQLNIAASGIGPAANVATASGLPGMTVPAGAVAAYPPLVPGYGSAQTPANSAAAMSPAAGMYPAAGMTSAPVMSNPSQALQLPPNPAVAQSRQFAGQPTQYVAPQAQYGQTTPPAAALATSPMAQSAPAAKPAPAMSAYSDNRYSEYFQRFPNAAAAPAVSPVAASAPPMAATQNYMTSPQGSPAAPPQYSPPASGIAQYTSPLANPVQYGSPVAGQTAIPSATMAQMSSPAPAAVNWPASAQSPSTTAATQPYTGPSLVGLPTGTITGLSPSAPVSTASAPAAAPSAVAGAPAFGLDGYCPVTLAEQKRWQVGDKRFGVTHRGRTYLFAGPVEQQKFLANPDRYSPAISGQDVVLALDQGQTVPGQRQFGVEYQNRFYLFASDASRRAFSQNPKRYAAEVLQAENPNRPLLR